MLAGRLGRAAHGAVSPGPPPWAGELCHRPWQPTRRRCPESQPSWLPACRKTQQNRRQTINTGKSRALPAAEGGWGLLLPAALTAVMSSSPTRREPRWRPSAPLERLGACSPTSAFPRMESGRARSYRVEGEPGRGRPGHPRILGWGREWLGQHPADNKLCPETAPCPSHQ